MHTRSSVVLIAVLVAVIAGGCGGGGTKKTGSEKYVSTVCSSLVTWEQGFSADSKKLTSQLSKLSTDLPKLKSTLTDYVNGLVAKTDDLQSKIKALGEPDVANGAQIEKKIDAVLAVLTTALKEMKAKVEALKPDNPAAFLRAGTSLYSSFSGLGSKLSGIKLNSAELKKAASKDPACQKLGAG